MSIKDNSNVLNSLVARIIDRGITRIARTRLVEELLSELTNYGKALASAGEYLIDTVACQIKLESIDSNNFTITLSGDEELSEPVEIQIADGKLLMHNFPIASNTVIILITSMLLRNTNEEVTVTVTN